ncbi:MAG: alanine racemase [Candidatus Aminicenantes bacterium]|nr:alanine racemase [Candidatus Aminicenantes bacterium]
MPLDEIRYKTWVEIDPAAFRHNIRACRALLQPRTGLWLVCKSNAYGHGLVPLATMGQKLGADGFCVDSVVEGSRLRESGVTKPILVLGPTLPYLLPSAAEHALHLTVSGWEALDALAKAAKRPGYHLKIDTGMHRQGFYPADLPKAWAKIRKARLQSGLAGVYTHFMAAKDPGYPGSARAQYDEFRKALAFLKTAPGRPAHVVSHCAASGAALLDRRYHLDAVRFGICLYGLWPSKELEMRFGGEMQFRPVLSWRSIVSEIKPARKGSFVGYDMTERLDRNSKLAIIPIGYWHGYDRGLSGNGEVLINGRRARVRGRISMDMIIVDVTDAPCKVGDIATLIGTDGKHTVTAAELGVRIGTTAYEMLTRINPLVKRIVL